MQVFVTKRPISEIVISTLIWQHRPSSTSYAKFYHFLPIGDELVPKSKETDKSLPEDLVILLEKQHLLPFSSRLLHRGWPSGKRDTSVFYNAGAIAATHLPCSKWAPFVQKKVSHSSLLSRNFARKRDGSNEEIFERSRTFSKTRSSKTREDGECGTHCNPRYDAILVLAGGQVTEGGVPEWVERRLDMARELQLLNMKMHRVASKIVCLGGGTPHKPPRLSAEGFVIHECSSCAEYLHSRGTAFSELIKEWGSYDTIGNGYFSLTQHVIPRRWQTLAVVTSAFHLPRTRAIFEWIFGLQGAGIAIQREPGIAAGGSQAQGFRLDFHGVPDDGIDESTVQARLEREQRSIEKVNVLAQQLHTLQDFHEWFHTKHKAYNTEDQHLFGKEEKLDPALSSY